MTDDTQPEAREFTMSQYASKDDMIGAMRKRIAELESELAAIGAGGVQALSAAPVAFLKSVIALCSQRGYSPANIEVWDKDDKWIADLWRQAESMLTTSPTPTAEQQASPKAAPGELKDHQILAITTAYEQGVGKGHQAYNSGKEIANPYSPAYGCDLAWQYGYKEGKEQAQRETKAAPQQEAQEPVAWLNPWRADQVTTDYDAYGEHGIPLYTAPQPAPDCHHRPPCDECAAIAAQRDTP